MAADEVACLAWQASRLDVAAFGDLYRLFSPQVLRYVGSRVPRRQEAEDLTSSIFEKAFAAMDRYEPSPAQFSTWLYTIARNKLVDYYRRRRFPLLDEPEAENDMAADPANDPEASLLAEESRHRLYRALRDLTDEQRQVVGCRFFYNLPIREVAEMMGKTDGAIKALQSRALQKLRRQLASE